MAVSYKRLWKLLVDKEMSKSDLRKKAEIAPNTMTKLRRDEEVSLTILSKICKTLHADLGILWSMCRMQKYGICIMRTESFWERPCKRRAATDRWISFGGACMDS